MAYVKQTWASGSEGGTLISATRLTHIEDGIFAAAAVADSAVTAAASAAAPRALADASDMDDTTPEIGDVPMWGGASWAPVPVATVAGFEAHLAAPVTIEANAGVGHVMLFDTPTATTDSFDYDPITGELTVIRGGWCHIDAEAARTTGYFTDPADGWVRIYADGSDLLITRRSGYGAEAGLGQGLRYIADGTVLTMNVNVTTSRELSTDTALRILRVG